MDEQSFLPYIDVDNLNHDEAEVRQGDVDVYDHIMQHDVYHQLGRPLEATDASTAQNGDEGADNIENGAQNDGPILQENSEVQHGTAQDVVVDATFPDAPQNDDLTADMDTFIQHELEDSNALQGFYSDGKSILDEFEEPAEFPSDID